MFDIVLPNACIDIIIRCKKQMFCKQVHKKILLPCISHPPPSGKRRKRRKWNNILFVCFQLFTSVTLISCFCSFFPPKEVCFVLSIEHFLGFCSEGLSRHQDCRGARVERLYSRFRWRCEFGWIAHKYKMVFRG